MKKRMIWLLILTAVFSTWTGLSALAANEDISAEYPSVVSISPGTNGFTVKWSAYPNAAKYRLFVRKNGAWSRIGDTAALSMNHTGLSDSTAYTYTVRALDQTGRYMSLYSVPGWTKTYRAAPAITSVAPSGNMLRIRWQTIPGVDCYRLYKRVGSGWQGVAFVDGDSYLDPDVRSGESYSYTVRGVNAEHTEFLSAYSAAGKSGRFVDMPQITSAESIDGVVRIRWNAVPGAVRYRVFYKNPTGWTGVGTTASTSFDYRVSDRGVTRTYTVRATDASGAYISDFSRTGRTHRFIETPRLTSIENVAAGQRFRWNPVDGAERYRIYRRTAGSAWVRIADVEDTAYVAQDLENDTVYTYTARCVTADGTSLESGFDRAGVTLRYIEAPRINAFTNLASGVLMTWDAPEEISRYRAFVRMDGTWKRLGDLKGNCCLHPDAQDGVSYTYTVRAIDKEGRYLSGYYTPGFANTYYAPPAFDAVTPSQDQILLSWEPREYAEGYRVYRRVFGGEWTAIADVSEAEYTDEALPEGVPYQYSLCCLDADANEMSDRLTDTLYYCGGGLAHGEITVDKRRLSFDHGAYISGYVSAEDVIRIAQAEVGTKGTYWKNCKYNTWYYGAPVSGDGYDWCAVFVNWVFNEAGAYDLLGSTSANCGQMGWDFLQKDMLVTSGYTVGDVVLFHWDDSPSSYVPGLKSLDHVGIIIADNGDGSYLTVEGNTGPSRDGEVMLQTRYDSQISCAGRPKYGFVKRMVKHSSGIAATGASVNEPSRLIAVPAGGEYRLRTEECTIEKEMLKR